MMDEDRMPQLQWINEMRTASGFLAVGSLLLLAGPQLIFPRGQFPAAIGGILLLLGWIVLGRTLFHEWRKGPGLRTAREGAMLSAYVASVIGFFVGLATLPFAFPQAIDLLFLGQFHYVPTVYAAIVVAQASIFLLGSSPISHRVASLIVAAGCAVLVSLVGVVLALQAVAMSERIDLWQLIFNLAGLTTIGYSTIALGWGAASRRRPGEAGIAPSGGS